MHPDGGATLLCTQRDDGCTVRELGPDGEVRATGDLVPGACMAYWPRSAGGGFVATNDAKHLHATITAVDAQGHAGASVAFSSTEWVYLVDGIEAPDGDLFVAAQLRSDLTLDRRKRRLAFGNYFVGAVLRLPPTLADVTWTRVFEATETSVTNFLPATAGGVDALVSFRGTMRAAGPGLTGSGKPGWASARVALDATGKPVTQLDITVGPGYGEIYALQTSDGGLAIVTPDPEKPINTNETRLAADGTRGAQTPLKLIDSDIRRLGDRTWMIECDCDTSKQPFVGPSRALELGGAGRIELAGTVGNGVTQWKSVVTQGDRAVAIGSSFDARTGTPIAFVAMGTVTGGKLDVSPMRIDDHLVLAPGCGPRAEAYIALRPLVDANAFSACKLPEHTLTDAELWPEGGLRSFRVFAPMRSRPSIDAATTACARKLVEPLLGCPTLDTAFSFGISYDLRSKP